MYAKIFAQIYDGTLCTQGPWEALVTFQQLLILADKHGVVDLTPGAISRRTTIPLDIIQKGIAALLLPDPESRTPTEDGRRILPLSEGRAWGWCIVNYKHYRELKREEDRREYHRVYWQEKRSPAAKGKAPETQPGLNSTQQPQPSQPNAYAEANAEAIDTDSAQAAPARLPDCPHQQIIDLFHKTLPTARKVKAWPESRSRSLRARWNEDPKRQNLDWWKRLFEYVGRCDFLMGRVDPLAGRKRFELGLDWLIKSENLIKVIEGNYDNEEVSA